MRVAPMEHLKATGIHHGPGSPPTTPGRSRQRTTCPQGNAVANWRTSESRLSAFLAPRTHRPNGRQGRYCPPAEDALGRRFGANPLLAAHAVLPDRAYDAVMRRPTGALGR